MLSELFAKGLHVAVFHIIIIKREREREREREGETERERYREKHRNVTLLKIICVRHITTCINHSLKILNLD